MKRISVIIPVQNNPDGLEALLQALVNQSYPRKWYEVLVVDNDSKDNTLAVAHKYADLYHDLVQALVEGSVRNSYVARNAGLERAVGETIAFIDSDCIPRSGWIEMGLEALHSQQADLVAGKVTFIPPSHPGIAESYDQLAHFHIERSVRLRGSAPTANLFVRRSVFEAMGPFPTYVTSGVDAFWTGNATKAGFKLVYAPLAEVLHPTRGLVELLKKHHRLGSGHPALWRNRGRGNLEIIRWVLRDLFPERISTVRDLIRERGTPDMERQFWSIWCLAWLCRVMTDLGRISGFLKLGKG